MWCYGVVLTEIIEELKLDDLFHIKQKENVYAHSKGLNHIGSVIADFCERHDIDIPLIADVGCGTGAAITLPLATKGYVVKGFDLDADSICLAQQISGKMSNLSYICQDLSRNDANERFDIAICAEVLEHLSDPEAMLLEIKRVLSKNGVTIVTVPNGYGWFEFEQFMWNILRMDMIYSFSNRVLGFFKVKVLGRVSGINISKSSEAVIPASLSQEPHMQRFTTRKLRTLFKNCDLDIVKMKKSSLFAGRFSHIVFGRLPRCVNINARVVEYLPACLAAGWYFVLSNEDKE